MRDSTTQKKIVEQLRIFADEEIRPRARDFDLKGASGSHRIDTLMPNGVHRILPGERKAFYCYMDESRWEKARCLIFYDRQKNAYPVDIVP